MSKYNPRNQLKIGGKMSTAGADKAGRMLAMAAIIFAFGTGACAFMIGLSYLIK